MEYFLCRAMEIGRLSSDQIDWLQLNEKKGWMPYEIQARFGVPLLKEHYQIPPDDLNAQAVHNQRLRGDFRRAGLFPDGGDISVSDLKRLHEFDRKVLDALTSNIINLFYMGPNAKKKKYTDEES